MFLPVLAAQTLACPSSEKTSGCRKFPATPLSNAMNCKGVLYTVPHALHSRPNKLLSLVSKDSSERTRTL
jgi:hypothetical protein